MAETVGHEAPPEGPSKTDGRVHIVVKQADYDLFIKIQGRMIVDMGRNVYSPEVFHELITKWDSLIKSYDSLKKLPVVE